MASPRTTLNRNLSKAQDVKNAFLPRIQLILKTSVRRSDDVVLVVSLLRWSNECALSSESRLLPSPNESICSFFIGEWALLGSRESEASGNCTVFTPVVNASLVDQPTPWLPAHPCKVHQKTSKEGIMYYLKIFTSISRESVCVWLDRFRLICASAMYPFRVSVDNHRITVISLDG